MREIMARHTNLLVYGANIYHLEELNNPRRVIEAEFEA